MTRFWMIVLLVLFSTLWWFLSRSISVVSTIAISGLVEMISWKQPPREILRNLLITSLWVGLVNLYIRLEWHHRPV